MARWSTVTGELLARFKLRGIGWKNVAPGIVLSPDGQTFAVATDETRVVRLYDATTGRPSSPAAGHTRPITSIAHSADGKLIATAGLDNRVCLWDLATGRLLRECTEKATPTRLAFSPDGRWLAVAADYPDSKFRLRAVHYLMKELVFSEHHGQAVTDLAFSPDGKLLATAATDNTVRIWDLDRENETVKIIGFKAAAYSVVWSPDGSLLASAGHDQIKVWDRMSGAVQSGKVGEDLWNCKLGFRPDGTSLIAMNDGARGGGYVSRNALGTWELRERWIGLADRLMRPRDFPKWHLPHPAISPNGRLLAAQETSDGLSLAGQVASGRVLVWQPDSDPFRLREIELSPMPVPGIQIIHPLAFSPEGRYLAVGNADGTVCLLRLAERGQVPTLPVVNGLPMPPTPRRP